MVDATFGKIIGGDHLSVWNAWREMASWMIKLKIFNILYLWTKQNSITSTLCRSSSWYSFSSACIPPWHPLFEQYDVGLVFENNDHTYRRTHYIRDGNINPWGIKYLGAGNWGTRTRDIWNSHTTWHLEEAYGTVYKPGINRVTVIRCGIPDRFTKRRKMILLK